MCELFAMSALRPTTVTLSLEEFSRHGGLTGSHKDGWGIGWYDQGDIRLVKEMRPAAASACVQFIQTNPFSSDLVMSHIRKATQGAIATRNSQPFVRELAGRWHCFAHNGDLQGISGDDRFQPGRFRPVGETDSERAFCALMGDLTPAWSSSESPPSLEARLDVVSAFAARLRAFGPANFLYCDGDMLFAHADRRHQPDGTISPPGLWRLSRQCPFGSALDAQGLHIGSQGGEQRVALFASVPLTAEGWVPMQRGEIAVARAGVLLN